MCVFLLNAFLNAFSVDFIIGILRENRHENHARRQHVSGQILPQEVLQLLTASVIIALYNQVDSLVVLFSQHNSNHGCLLVIIASGHAFYLAEFNAIALYLYLRVATSHVFDVAIFIFTADVTRQIPAAFAVREESLTVLLIIIPIARSEHIAC